MGKEDFIKFFYTIWDSIISLYNRVKTYAVKQSDASRNEINKKSIKSISYKKKHQEDENLDVVAVKVKRVTVKKTDKNEN